MGCMRRLGEWGPEWVCSYESRKTSVSAQSRASELKKQVARPGAVAFVSHRPGALGS